MPRAGVTGRWRPFGREGESKAEEGASDVSQDRLCVSLGIQGFFPVERLPPGAAGGRESVDGRERRRAEPKGVAGSS